MCAIYLCIGWNTKEFSQFDANLADTSAIMKRLKTHLEWRKEHGLLGERSESENTTDASLWEASVKQAWEFEETNGEEMQRQSSKEQSDGT